MKITVNAHSSIRAQGNKVLYFDPFGITSETHDADIVLITHEHFDHFSPDDMRKVMNENSRIVLPFSCAAKAKKSGFDEASCLLIGADGTIELDGTEIRAVPAYNVGKQFHPKASGWVGYVVNDGEATVYYAGDTDALEENTKIACDVALVPVGGTYTMTAEEAADFVNRLKPACAVPVHYGSVVGDAGDGERFAALVDKEIRTELLIGK